MNALLTIELPETTQTILEEEAREEGVSLEDYASKALKNYLFSKQFHRLRERFKEESDREYTEEEIFEMVS